MNIAGSVSNISSTWVTIYEHTYIAEWFLLLRTILRKPTLHVPRTKTFELRSHVTSRATLVIFHVDLGTFLKQAANADLAPNVQRPNAGLRGQNHPASWDLRHA